MTESIPHRVVRIPLKEALTRKLQADGGIHNGLLPKKAREDQLKKKRDYAKEHKVIATHDQIFIEVEDAIRTLAKTSYITLELPTLIKQYPDKYPILCQYTEKYIRILIGKFCTREKFERYNGKHSSIFVITEGWR